MIYKNDSRFIPPYTEHGMACRSQDPIHFEIGARRCQNSTDNPFVCISNEKMDRLFQMSNYRIQFVDNYFNVMNYEQPIVRYVMEIMGGASSDTSASNYINFNNVDMVTHDGYIFDQTNEISSYKFADRVEIVSKIQSLSDKIFFLRLEGQNQIITLDRTYITLQEILANIGGLVKILFLIAKFLNYFHNNFLVKQELFWKVLRSLIDFKRNPIAGSLEITRRRIQSKL